MKDLTYFIFLLLISNNIIAQTWSTPKVIGNSNYTTLADIAVDQDDNIHVVFEINNRGDYNADDIYYTMYNGVDWATQINISNTDTTSNYPQVKVDRSNNVHVIWGDPKYPSIQDVLYRVNINSEWSLTRNLFHAPSDTFAVGPIKYDFDSHNRMHLIFFQMPDLKYRYVEIDNLSEIKIIKRFGFTQDFEIHEDRIHLTYISAPINRDESIYYRSFNVDSIHVDTSFHSETDIVRNIQGHPIRDPQIYVDSTGRIHLIWIEGIDFTAWANEIYHMYSDDGINWSDAVDITHNGGTSHFPGVAIDSKDNIHIVWAQSPYKSSLVTEYIGYAYFNGMEWSEPDSILAPTNGWPHIAIDSKDHLHIVYNVKLNGEHKVVYSATRPSPVNIVRSSGEIPEKFELLQNYPNPFNSSTTITFNLPSTEEVSVGIYNTNGELVKNIISKNILTPGIYKVNWDGTDSSGNLMTSGIYLCRLEADNFVRSTKMVLLK